MMVGIKYLSVRQSIAGNACWMLLKMQKKMMLQEARPRVVLGWCKLTGCTT